MKNYEFFEKKYLNKDEYQFEDYFRLMLVHTRRMENEEDYRKAVEAKLYRLDGWEEKCRVFGLEVQ